jgi:predicted flap endonuclease-1-like 5' DNA nuclease
MKGLVWVLLAVLLGIVVGWLLRSVAAKRQVERARAANLGTADRDELELLRQRIANLEPAVGERDRLRAALDDAIGGESSAMAPASAQPPAPAPAADTAPDSAGDAAAAATDATGPPDLDAAAVAIGKRIDADDLTVIEGVGPKIAELCHGIGIRTWSDLAETEVSLLRTMLNDAGQRFKAHDPGTWPQQAALLADGAWDEFVALTGRLDGGRPVG